LARDWQAGELPRLDTPEGQAAIEPMVAWADIVIVDNRACLPDDYVTTLEAVIDSRSMAAGRYQLGIRRVGGEWQMFPALLR
jgi:hypothetical protein